MPVYKQYNQEALDLQYNNRLNASDHEYHLQQWERVSHDAGEKYKVYKNIPYGELQRETLDIFPSGKSGAKTLMFIHGGYWYKNNPSDFYLLAEAFKPYDITIVLIGYPLMPAYPMDQLVCSCRRAISWAYKNMAEYNGDPDQLYIAGHSAGGHLASMMLATNWPQFDAKLNSNPIKGICAISGLYNLVPVQLSNVNINLKMDTAMAIRNSPVQLSPETVCPMVLAVGAEESDEYTAQAMELFNKWSGNAAIQLLEIPGTNHFSVLTSMLENSSLLHTTMCGLMGI